MQWLSYFVMILIIDQKLKAGLGYVCVDHKLYTVNDMSSCIIHGM